MFDFKKLQSEDVVLFGAGISGKDTLKLCLDNQIKVGYFCDNNPSKVDTIYEGIAVKSLSFIKENIENLVIIIAVHDDFAGQIYEQLYQEGIEELYFRQDLFALITLKEGMEALSSIAAYRRRIPFIQKLKRTSEKVIADVIDLTITEKCSLKCKDCCNLMQYYEKPEHVCTDMLFQTIDKLDEIFEFVNDLRMLGGEPFINPDIYQIIKYASNKEHIEHILLFTNATIPLKEEELKELDQEKVVFVLSNYGSLSKFLTFNTELLEKYKFGYGVLDIDMWTECVSFEYQNYTMDQLKEIFAKCCVSEYGVISDGKMYHCPYAASVDRLHALPKETAEYIDLLQDKREMKVLRDSIKEFLYDKEYLQVCKYCKGRDSQNCTLVEPAIQTSKPLAYKKY